MKHQLKLVKEIEAQMPKHMAKEIGTILSNVNDDNLVESRDKVLSMVREQKKKQNKERYNMKVDLMNMETRDFNLFLTKNKKKWLKQVRDNKLTWRFGCLITLWDSVDNLTYKKEQVENMVYDDNEEYHEIYEHFCPHNDFRKHIYQNQFKNKVAYRFWEGMLGENPTRISLFSSIVRKFSTKIGKENMGTNRFCLVVDLDGIDILDINILNSKLQIQELVLENAFEYRHSPYLQKVIGGEFLNKGYSNISYTAYDEDIQPMKVISFDENPKMSEIGKSKSNFFIRPIGYYTFHNGDIPYSNIASIYYKTKVKHTKNDFIIYELFDTIDIYTDAQKNTFECEYLDAIYDAEYDFEETPKKKKKKHKKPKRETPSSESDSVESEETPPQEPSDSEEEQQVEEGEIVEEKSIISWEYDRECPEIVFKNQEIDGKELMIKMIHKSFRRKSKIFKLLKDYKTIIITQGLHNSYYDQERFNHFNCFLRDWDGNRTGTFHIYTNYYKILYYTSILKEYD